MVFTISKDAGFCSQQPAAGTGVNNAAIVPVSLVVSSSTAAVVWRIDVTGIIRYRQLQGVFLRCAVLCGYQNREGSGHAGDRNLHLGKAVGRLRHDGRDLGCSRRQGVAIGRLGR